MVSVPFFEIPYRDKLDKNVNSQYVQVIPRSTLGEVLFKSGVAIRQIRYITNAESKVPNLCFTLTGIDLDSRQCLLNRASETFPLLPKLERVR